MPGWYIHMDAARNAIWSLNSNSNAASIFSSDSGPSATQLQLIAQGNPAYFALGAIGPDIFFLLPDFKPPAGTGLWGAANMMRILFTWWDEHFLGPYEDLLGPIAANTTDELGALTGGLSEQLSTIFSQASSFLVDFTILLISEQTDIFSLLSSGVPQGFDEQTFFWSDMLHYRKTYEFAHALWTSATTDQQRAFALGWMTHLGTDVAGHCFVNEKCGGPYRLHWQRHHVVENHMDANVYDSERGSQPIYNMMSNSALHLWIAFNPDGSSYLDCFSFPQQEQVYDPGDTTPEQMQRKSKWDIDSSMPSDLADYLAAALKAVYNDATTVSSKGASAAAPQIIEAIAIDRVDGYATGDDIVNTYWWLYKYVKWTTTDYYKIRRPDPPAHVIVMPFPSPPGSSSGGGPNPTWDNFWQDVHHHPVCALLAWLGYVAQVLAYEPLVLAGELTSSVTYGLRDWLYEHLELPLYNGWLALHWFLSMTGYVLPMRNEVNSGLTTLGVSVLDTWPGIAGSLNDFSGGLGGVTTPSTEPSGHDAVPHRKYPTDVVRDSNNWLAALANYLPLKPCGGQSMSPSEFTRPWRYPVTNNAETAVPIEPPMSIASPYVAGQDATVLMGGSPGDNAARAAFEGSQSEAQTIQLANANISANTTLGDPVDYSAYVIALLTRDHAGDPAHPIANFNLDSDRGYAYKCWDWVRSTGVMGVPNPAFRSILYDVDPHGHRAYHAPIAPGSGWCADDLTGGAPAGGSPSSPVNAPTMQDENNEHPVRIRYIDIEDKYV